MSNDNKVVFEKMSEILADYKDLDKNDITLDSTFDDLNFDSLDTVELVMRLEDEFGITIELDEKLKTVGALVEYTGALIHQ